MRKLILTLSIATLYLSANAQKSAQEPSKPKNAIDTCQIILNKQTAEIILRGLQTSLQTLPGSETITAKASTEAQQVNYFFIQAILKRWPELNQQAKK